MIVDPLEDWSEPEFSSCDGLHHEVAGRKRVCFEIMSVNQEKGVSSGKSNALVAVKERMLIREGLGHSSCGLCGDGVVLPDLRRKDRGFHDTVVPPLVS